MGTINNRPLHAYVRYDGQWRIVAGSLILRRKMPKVGRWVEINAYKCCNTTNRTTLAPGTCTTFGDASNFAVLGSSTVTNTHYSVVNGDLGLYPGTSVTGFPPGVVNGTQHITDGTAGAAKISAQATYDCLSTLPRPTRLLADIGGTTVTAGTYDFASSVGVTGILTLDGEGDPNAIFVFQIPSTFIPATYSVIQVTNSAQPCNVYWLVGSSATLSIGSTTVGNIIAVASVTLNTHATLTGRAFALTGAVTMDTNTITRCDCSINPCTMYTTTTTTTEVPITTTTTTIAETTTTTTTIGG